MQTVRTRARVAVPPLLLDALHAPDALRAAYSLHANAVTTVEPASDFADAIADSARLNCWSHRHRMVNAFACERDDGIGPRTCMRSRRAWQGYRAGGGPPNGLRERLRETPGQAIERLLFLDPPRELSSPSSPSSAPSSSVLGAAGSPSSSASSVVYYDLIKMDGDGPEGGWLRTIQKLIGLGRLRVGAIVMEGNHLDSTTMHRMQSVMGFTAYRLDEADGRRYITPEGWDAYSPAGTPMARLSLSRALHLRQEEVSYAPALGAAPRTSGAGAGGGAGGGAAGAAGVEASAGGETPDEGTEPGRSLKAPRDAYELEMFSIRAMRHLWRVRDNLTIAQWDVLLGPIRRYYPKESAVKQRSHVAHQWLLTTDRHLTEPTAQPRYRRHQAAVQAFHRAYHAKTNPVGGAGGAGDAAVPSFSELYV